MRNRILRAKRALEEHAIIIPQEDGTARRFRPSAGEEALFNWLDRLGAGEEAPSEHPLIEAARNSTDPEWAGSFFAVNTPEEWTKPIKGCR